MSRAYTRGVPQRRPRRWEDKVNSNDRIALNNSWIIFVRAEKPGARLHPKCLITDCIAYRWDLRAPRGVPSHSYRHRDFCKSLLRIPPYAPKVTQRTREHRFRVVEPEKRDRTGDVPSLLILRTSFFIARVARFFEFFSGRTVVIFRFQIFHSYKLLEFVEVAEQRRFFRAEVNGKKISTLESHFENSKEI